MRNSAQAPKALVITKTQLSPTAKTDLFNCNCHSFDEVIEQIIKAIGCSRQTAYQMANIADQFGVVTVYKGEVVECERVANVLGSIGLNVRVSA